ncbi:Uncharacterised protein [Vibrio cholerae]|nr:Uncharacterised protein [Vibrio cholerae]
MVSCLSLINRQAMAGLVRPVLWRSAIAMPIVLTPPNCPVMPVSMHVSATNGKLGALN